MRWWWWWQPGSSETSWASCSALWAHVQAPCLGFVLTGAERETEDYYGGYGRYGGGGVAQEPAANANHRAVSVAEEGRVSRSTATPPGPIDPEPS